MKRYPTLFATRPTATPPGPASGAFCSVTRADGRLQSASCLRQAALRLWPALPHRTGEYACGALGRKTPDLRHLSASRDGRVVNKVGYWIVLLLLIAMSPGWAASSDALEELLTQIEQAASAESRIDQSRLQRFIGDRNNQRRLLDEAKAELARQEQRADQLRNRFDVNELELVELETLLDERMGNLGELFGVVRQVAGDVAAKIDDSMVSAQWPDRSAFLSELAQRRELPQAKELARMWLEMVREIAHSGRIVRFKADVINADGQRESDREVVRIGVFNVVSEGRFLLWDGDQGTLVELPRQPAGRFQSMARALQEARQGAIVDMAIDGTRGAILGLVVRSPTLIERFRQSGLIGKVIVVLGALGLLISIWKGLKLWRIGRSIKRQLNSATARQDNPLGRVMQAYYEQPDQDVSTLELKLDEAILRETSPLESGLPLIKVLYVVAPLIGLLGTVVGMILTFQQITLFGTGDPRMMASGISMALMTTVLGLIVAIPLTLLHSVLHSRARSLIQVLEEQAAGIIARVAEQRHAVAG